MSVSLITGGVVAARLAEILAGIKVRFLLSLNDRPEVREVFAAFAIGGVETTWSVEARHKRAGEVLMSALKATSAPGGKWPWLSL